MNNTLEPLCDLAPEMGMQPEEILTGLTKTPKILPPKYLYDSRGSRLFDRICDLPEYYPTRSEVEILNEHAFEMAASIGNDAVLIEYGSGSSLKTDILLKNLTEVAAYVAIDIAREHLLTSVESLSERFPDLRIFPVCADYMRLDTLPIEGDLPGGKRVVFFPGSTLGNLHPQDAASLLRRMRRLYGPDGYLILGVDLRKDKRVLENAYNDSQNVTAQFNLNLLRRLNRELGADFRLEAFRHLAFFNAEKSRIEMHLESLCKQSVTLVGKQVWFEKGETLHTENSYKYGLEEIRSLLRATGFDPVASWTDSRGLFSLHFGRSSY